MSMRDRSLPARRRARWLWAAGGALSLHLAIVAVLLVLPSRRVEDGDSPAEGTVVLVLEPTVSSPEQSAPSPAATPEPARPQPVTGEPAAPDPATPQPATAEPAAPEPARPKLATAQPTTPQTATGEPATPEPAAHEPGSPERPPVPVSEPDPGPAAPAPTREALPPPAEVPLPPPSQPIPSPVPPPLKRSPEPPHRASIPPRPSRGAAAEATSPQPGASQVLAPQSAAAPTAASSGDVIGRYLKALAAHLHGFDRYPALARTRSEEGTVIVGVTILRDGHVAGVSVEHPSGHVALDQAAIDTVKRAEPLPPIPDAIPGPTLRFDYPVRFRLE